MLHSWSQKSNIFTHGFESIMIMKGGFDRVYKQFIFIRQNWDEKLFICAHVLKVMITMGLVQNNNGYLLKHFIPLFLWIRLWSITLFPAWWKISFDFSRISCLMYLFYAIQYIVAFIWRENEEKKEKNFGLVHWDLCLKCIMYTLLRDGRLLKIRTETHVSF